MIVTNTHPPTPTFTTAVVNAVRHRGAGVLSRAADPSDTSISLMADKLDPRAAAVLRHRQDVETEHTFNRLSKAVCAASAVAFGLICLTGLAAILANPVLVPIGAAILITGAGGMLASMVAGVRSARSASRSGTLAHTLDKQLHQDAARSGCALKAPQLPPRTLSAPNVLATKESSSRPMPCSFPGDIALTELLVADDLAAQQQG